MARKIITHLCLVLTSIFLAVFSSLNSFALDLNTSVTSIWSGNTPYDTQWVYNDGSNSIISPSGNFICGAGTDVRRRVLGIILNFSNDISSYIVSGDFIEFRIGFTADNNSNMNIDFAPTIFDYYGNFDIIDINYQNAGVSASEVKIIAMARSNGVHSIYLRRDDYLNPFFSMINTSGTECATAGNWTAYRLQGDGSQAIINAINSNNSTSAINNAKREIVSAIEEQQSSQEEIYQDEKDTINDNGDTAKDSAGDLSFDGFSVGNPLLNWIALFTDNTCVSIPTIASWIHSNETQVCSPWSSSVRGVTTPIITVLSGTILFGFIVHWLKQKDGQELS